MLSNLYSRRLLKKVQMQGGKRCGARGVLACYVAAPRERANAADGPFSATRSEGHEVTTAADEGLLGRSDQEVGTAAHAEGRMLTTLGLEFADL